MPDKRSHRGAHPDDQRLFAAGQLEALRAAITELSWLLTRGYATDSALKLVGDRQGLTARQRVAVRRSACSDDELAARRSTLAEVSAVRGARLGVDGYNLLITVESALAGGVVLVGRDDSYRDLASIHGTYRRVEETLRALELIADAIAALRPAGVDWYLDSPVSNSGRLKTRIAELLEERAVNGMSDPPWNIELLDDPDGTLAAYEGIVASSDSVILSACGRWVNLAGEVIAGSVADAWVVDLSDGPCDG